MGMFDQLLCAYPLPDPEVQDAVFQTKSLDNALETYYISEDGRLLRAKNPVIRQHEDSTLDMLMVPEDGVWDEPVNHSGPVDFYYSTKAGRWVEYRAHFSKGQLTDLSKRKEADRKWGEAFAATTETQWTKLRGAIDEEVAEGEKMSGDDFLAQRPLS